MWLVTAVRTFKFAPTDWECGFSRKVQRDLLAFNDCGLCEEAFAIYALQIPTGHSEHPQLRYTLCRATNDTCITLVRGKGIHFEKGIASSCSSPTRRERPVAFGAAHSMLENPSIRVLENLTAPGEKK